jgi:hypothetical protein
VSIEERIFDRDVVAMRSSSSPPLIWYGGLGCWRARFVEQGLDGVGTIAAGRGGKSWLPDGVTVAEIIRVTLEENT